MNQQQIYDSDNIDLAIAMAASAYAVHSLEESKFQLKNTNTVKKEPNFMRPFSQQASMKKPSAKDARSSSFMRSSSQAEAQRQMGTSRGHVRGSHTKSDAWEKVQIVKIQKQYDDIQSQIQAWENEKKIEAKREMERRKEELEVRRSRNLRHYYRKIARIDNIASGAKVKAEEKRKQEEHVVKEKVQKIRSTGKVPIKYCFCF